MLRRTGAVLALVLAFPGAAMAASAVSTATMDGSFADTCRDFTAHSSKDISHVVIHYTDGRDVKDERITTPDYSIDGGAGDEIDSVDVKSGTTRETFTCTGSNDPPSAILKIKTPTSCFPFSEILYCHPDEPRTVWTRPDNGEIQWPYAEPERQCPPTYSFRGTSSTDPNDDIVSWSIDFGDGTSVSGSWGTDPPAEVTHPYPCFFSPTVTLTVTDSAGESDADSLVVHYVDARPD